MSRLSIESPNIFSPKAKKRLTYIQAAHMMYICTNPRMEDAIMDGRSEITAFSSLQGIFEHECWLCEQFWYVLFRFHTNLRSHETCARHWRIFATAKIGALCSSRVHFLVLICVHVSTRVPTSRGSKCKFASFGRINNWLSVRSGYLGLHGGTANEHLDDSGVVCVIMDSGQCGW